MTVDWSKFKGDVERLYLQERKSAAETVRQINEKHESKITLRQFKFKYGGLKKLQAKEWMAIIYQIRRIFKGERYGVYLYNRRQSDKRVERAFKLYEKKSDDFNSTGIDLGINTINQHRIEIRTSIKDRGSPTPHKELDEANRTYDPGLNSGNFEEFHKRISAQSVAWNFSTSSDMPLPNFLSNEAEMSQEDCKKTPPTPDGEEGFDFFNFEQWNYDQLEFLIPEQFSTLQGFDNESTKLLNISYCLFWEDMEGIGFFALSLAGMSQKTIDTAYNPHGQQLSRPVVRGKYGWLFSYLIKADSKLIALEKAAFQVEAIISNDQSNSVTPRESSDEQTLNQIFLIIAYLVSNNNLEEDLFSHFIFWAIDHSLIRQLNLFLCLVVSYGMVFRNSLLILIPKLKSYDKSKLPRPSLLKSFPDESLDMIQQGDKRLFHSLAGVEIIAEAVRANHLEAVRYLFKEGVNINKKSSLGTPLALAAEKGLNNMVFYLIESGADPNCGMSDSALLSAITHKEFAAARILLHSGARIDPSWHIQGMAIIQWISREMPALKNTVLEYMAADEASKIYFLVEAAGKGESALKRHLINHEIGTDEMLEKALCFAIKVGSDGAVRTLLSHGVDPRVQKYKAQYKKITGRASSDDIDPLMLALGCEQDIMQNILYHLRRADLKLEKESLETFNRKRKGEGIQVLDGFIIALAKAGFDLKIIGPSALEVVLTQKIYGASAFKYGDALFQCGTWIDGGCPINEYGFRGLSGLQAAAKSGNLTLVLEFIKRGANINLEASDGGLTALQAAAKSGKSIVVDCLLDFGADYKLPPAKNNGFTALEAAAYPESGDSKTIETDVLSILERLIGVGAPINRHGGDASRLLLGLITSNYTTCLTFVVQSGAGVEGMASISYELLLSPLQAAAMQLNVAAIDLLMRKKADINESAYYDGGYTALQAAMLKSDMPSEQLEVVNFLLLHGADVNSAPIEKSGRTALQEAACAENASPDIIKLLLSWGADINAPPAEQNGFTALQGAATRGHLEIIRLLIEHGAHINAPAAPRHGRTAVEAAAENGRLDALKWLLNHGATPPCPETGFERAIQFASNNGHWHIADFLHQHEQFMKSRQHASSFELVRR